MNKPLLFLIVAVPFLTAGYLYMGYEYYMEGEGLQLTGTVTDIVWESRNHQIPLIVITKPNGQRFNWNSAQIILTERDVKVGDQIDKKKDSKICIVNVTETQCVR